MIKYLDIKRKRALMWDPDQYRRFAAERARPFAELVARMAEYRDRMRQAYPPRPFGTMLPFRRVFVVAHRPGSTSAEREAPPAVRSGD
jgi:trans-aconitate methyltransferase